jgi:hypothetical protein
MRIVYWIEGELRSKFTGHNTSFRVGIYRRQDSWANVIEICFHDSKGREHCVKQEEKPEVMWGYVSLREETITTIMLLLG